MTTKDIEAAIITSRNILLNGNKKKFDSSLLKDSLKSLDLVSVLWSREIISYCLNEAIRQIDNLDYSSAVWILNLIHNLPLDRDAEMKWDIDYFIHIELGSFLDRYQEIRSSRMIFLHICKILGSLKTN